MRLMLTGLGTFALLTACTSGTTTTPTAPNGSTSPTASTMPGASAAPVATAAPALQSAARLTVDGKEVKLADSMPRITLLGGGVVTISHLNRNQEDRTFGLEITLKALKSTGGLKETFKQEDVDRLEFTLEQFVSGRSSSNKWTKIYDVPSSGVVLSAKNEGGRVSGTLTILLQPAEQLTNEEAARKAITVKYEWEAALNK